MASYIALLRKDASSDFGVDFPDFPGCITAGRSLDEAKNMAVEVLMFHVEGMIEDGAQIPAPSNIETVMADSENADAVAFLVDLPAKREKKGRYNITMAPSVMARIEAAAGTEHVSRSAFITEAVLEKINSAN